MGMYECLWISMGLWLFMDVYVCIGIYGCLWLSMGAYGFLVLYGYL